jgi:hypothetical protein
MSIMGTLFTVVFVASAIFLLASRAVLAGVTLRMLRSRRWQAVEAPTALPVQYTVGTCFGRIAIIYIAL